ncbi:hypothetical protein ASZ90_014514 [hydrocarbon metagenome]|uniref:Uncharacterized protein n=1 Tax=hydrocarbon metagenome TaxID=938273 RepID=A0A0W8F509_9ZZZZ
MYQDCGGQRISFFLSEPGLRVSRYPHEPTGQNLAGSPLSLVVPGDTVALRTRTTP